MGCRRSLRKSGLLTCSVHARQVEGATAMNIAAGNGNRRPGASADTLPGRSAARDSSLLGNQPNLQERQRRLFLGKCQSSFQTPFVTVTCLASPSPTLESQVWPMHSIAIPWPPPLSYSVLLLPASPRYCLPWLVLAPLCQVALLFGPAGQRRFVFGKRKRGFQKPVLTVTCLALPSPALESQESFPCIPLHDPGLHRCSYSVLLLPALPRYCLPCLVLASLCQFVLLFGPVG